MQHNNIEHPNQHNSKYNSRHHRRNILNQPTDGASKSMPDACNNRNRRRAGWPAVAGAGILLLLSGGVRANAQAIGVTINGQPVVFQDIGPQQLEGRTLVPVRGVLEKLGATIAFDNRTQTVIASTPSIDIQLKIGSKVAMVNAKEVTLDTPAQTIHDHTFVPLRFLGEALGADVSWDAASRTVRIITKDALNASVGRPADADRDRRRAQDTRGPEDRARDKRAADDRAAADKRARDTGPAPVINGFRHNAGHWLRAGDTLEATLDGTPGGQAGFRIPGLVDQVPMREAAPGHYVGDWRVPADRPMQLKGAAVIGSLQIGSRTAPLLQAGETVSVDAIPPQIRDAAPADTNVNDPRPNISAAFEDEGSGLDRKSARLLVNGRDVTNAATITRDFISYRPDAPLNAGSQQIELKVMDMAGNQAGARWTFIETARAAGGIRSVSDNADHVFQPGDTLRVEMSATPGCQAAFSAGSIQNVPMREDQPGHYVCDYTIRRGDDMAGRPIAFRLRTPDGERFEQAGRNAARINTGKPPAPIVTYPGPGDAPADPLVVRGRATPNSKVRLKVDYENRLFGLVALRGTAVDAIVTTDRNGNWASAPINLGGIAGSRGVEYTLSATAISATEEQSDTTTARFRLR